MKNLIKKPFFYITAAVVAGVILGLVLVYIVSFNKESLTENLSLKLDTQDTSLLVKESELIEEGWTKYTHEDGYSFAYPSEWTLDLVSGSGPKASILFSPNFEGLSFYGGPARGSRINIDRYSIVGWNGIDSISGIRQPNTTILEKPAAYYETVKSDYGKEFYRITTDMFWNNENVLKISLENPLNNKYLNKNIYDSLLNTVSVE